MSSTWSRKRREKRIYRSYFHPEYQSVPVEAGKRPANNTEPGKRVRVRPTGNSSDTNSDNHSQAGGSDARNIDVEAGPSELLDSSSVTSSESETSDSDFDSAEPFDLVTNKDEDSEILIRNWAIKHQIKHCALRDLLHILNSKYDAKLPADPRTICKTPTDLSNQIKSKCGGEYFNFGVKNALRDFLESVSDFERSRITSVFLKVNCDGLPLSKSSGKQFWPILVQFCTDYTKTSEPYPVGIFFREFQA